MKHMIAHELLPLADAAASLVELSVSFSERQTNVVIEALGGLPFVEYSHYPEGDFFDPVSGVQFYFHAHPPERKDYTDFGHFHLFMHLESNDVEKQSATMSASETYVDGSEICHIAGISVDKAGIPIGLFTTNKWVTGGAWLPAEDVCLLLDSFCASEPVPENDLFKWVLSVARLFRNEIGALIRERDKAIILLQKQRPAEEILDDRELEVTSWQKIDIENRLTELRSAMGLL
jgi:hypothetical protein